MNPERKAFEARKQFLEDCKTLTRDQYTDIFRILKRNGISYSENSNGIFFDLQTVNEDAFSQLVQFMEFCKKQSADEHTRETVLNHLRSECADVEPKESTLSSVDK